MRIKLKNTGYSGDMKKHYQKLIEAGWGAMISKETRIIEGKRPGWDIEETTYEIFLHGEIEPDLLFDLSEALGEELIIYKEDGQPVIEIYDNWRE